MQQQHASGILRIMAAIVILFIHLLFNYYLVPAAAACGRHPAAA
jgi:hypothetical protein